jgi:hypothetical protein
MINLNDDQFDGGGNVKIFNGGKAGIVDNVKYLWYVKVKMINLTLQSSN